MLDILVPRRMPEFLQKVQRAGYKYAPAAPSAQISPHDLLVKAQSFAPLLNILYPDEMQSLRQAAQAPQKVHQMLVGQLDVSFPTAPLYLALIQQQPAWPVLPTGPQIAPPQLLVPPHPAPVSNEGGRVSQLQTLSHLLHPAAQMHHAGEDMGPDPSLMLPLFRPPGPPGAQVPQGPTAPPLGPQGFQRWQNPAEEEEEDEEEDEEEEEGF
eukprot:jgi/Botrbrau1/3266/Bobra.174_1s0037.1